MAAAEAEKQALIDELSKPSGLSEDEKVKRASTVIQRAVRNGLHEVQVYRFPNVLCTDRGRAINQMEPGWENTLTGMPKEIFHLWKDYLQPRGYKIAYQIIDFPGRRTRRYRHHAELVTRPARPAFGVIGQHDLYSSPIRAAERVNRGNGDGKRRTGFKDEAQAL